MTTQYVYIIDIQIGFQNISYIFFEPGPQFYIDIKNTVFLEKQDGRRTEQTYAVVLGVNDATPSANIQAATHSTSISEEDYTAAQRSFLLVFPPEDQLLDFPFTLHGL